MAVTTRSLALGLTGSDVAALQRWLAQLGLSIPATEQEASSFGQGTHDVVAQFQTAHGLQATGIVDAATATAVSEAVAEASYTVNGTVSSPTSASVGGLNVQLVDKNVGADVPLGVTTTQADGGYTVTAVIAVPALQQRHKTRPDLQVRVSAGTTFLAASSVAYDVAATITLDVALPPDASLPSEYETLTTSLAGLYTGKLGALQETDQQQDITFLANKSKWDARLVAMAALADQFSQITVPAAPGSVAPPPVSLKPEFYYALFRAGLPANADTLFQAGAAAVQEVWQQAVAQGVIPNALATGIAGAVKSFQALSAAHALAAAPPVGPSTLQAMLQATLPGATQQQQFAQLCAQYREDRATFWTQVTASFGTTTAQQLQFNGQLYYLTLNNVPLVSALATAEKQAPLASALDLALRGYHDPAKWTPLIGNSIPSQIPGATADEQRANYANLLATQVRIAFPTAVVADLVQRGTFPLASSTTKAADVAAFLTVNAASFDIGTEPVEAYIVRAKLAGAPAPVVAEIKRLQRVRQITPDDQSMATLIQHQLDSAYAITRYDLAGFTRAFQDKLGGVDIAVQIHARARQIYGAVLNVATSYLIARRSPATGGTSPLIIPFSAPSPNPPYPVVAYPTLENLFGSLDYCNCEECRSILSPAAYLVDLLNSIDIPVPSTGYQNPLTTLLQRRPDLQYLPLTCANTNTALPYIDLVNETLEYFVVNSLSLAGYQGFDTGSTVTSAELMANPQNVNQAAYTALQGQFFPPPLPFDRPLALLRLHLQKIGVALPELMAALRPSDAIERGTAHYGWRDILIEQLAISREEYRLFTDGTLKLQGLYGYPTLSDSAVLTTLQSTSLRDLCRRIGVSYDDLFAIVATRFINPNANLIPKVERLNTPFAALQALKNGVGDPSIVASFKAALPAGLDARLYGGSTPTDYDAIVRWVTDGANYARIMGIITISNPTNSADQCSATALELRYANTDNTANALTATDFVKLMRFIRLWRKLGLGIPQTDAILSALYPAADLPTGTNDAASLPSIDAGFAVLLPRIGFLMQVMKALGLTPAAGLAQLLACWAPIDTTGTGSLYARMFLSPTLLQPDPAFADDGYGNFLGNTAEPLLNHQSILCAAFGITGAEFGLITGNALPGSLGFGPATALTLANISAVFRVGWLAHLLGISVREFMLLRYCTGLDPFALLDPASPPPAEPSVIRFIRLVRALAAAGIRPVQALYLMWNQDISGNSAPSTEAVTNLALGLRAAFAAVEAQFTLVDDPDGSIAKQMMGLVYDSATADFFFGLLNNTFTTSVACAARKPTLAQPIIDASSGRLSYDDLRKQLSFAGVLDPATQAAIDQAITNNGSDPALHDALARLGASNKQAVDLFFATYKELLPLFSSYMAATGTVQNRRKALLAGLLPDLTRRRKQQQALTSITGAAGADRSFAIALMQDASIMHAAADGTAAAASDLTAIEAGGLTARFFLTNNIATNPDQTVDCALSLSYGSGTVNTLPSGSGGSPIAATWSGYLDVPQDGFYNIAVTADAGATITLRIAGTAVAMAASGNVWNNQAPISFAAGSLTPIVLTATSIKTTMRVSWETQGLGSQPISPQYLYAGMLIDRLRSTYVGFLKATALATALSLTSREMAWLGTATSFAVNTSDNRDKLAAGNATFTPSSMSNIKVGSKLIIDSGAAQETVTVTAVTGTTFRAVTRLAHDGTGVPFPIVSQAFPAIGQGWLSFLSASTATGPTTSASLRDVLSALVAFLRIKLAVSPRDERLLAIIQNPTLTLADGSSALLALTGWSRDSLAALLQQFFGGTQLAGLSNVENFRRVYDAYAFVNACRITAAVLIAGTTNAPPAAVVAALQSALRALYADTDWLTAVRPINDAIRIQQRDALVAYILQQLGDGNGQAPGTTTTTADAPAGSTVLALANTGGIVVGMSARGANISAGATVVAVGGSTVTISAPTLADVPPGSSLTFVQDTSAINTADKLFEYFLIDPQTQPPVDTSRIRLALSSVQLFIERVLRNLEPQVQPADLQTLASQWQWMKRYRVWQANREVFLWPENWLYPELRDDPSPLFQQTMRNLLQGDITDDAAAEAYLDYLTGLEAIAKLEPCGLFHVPAAPGGDEAAYVVARTAGAHRKHYFRQLQHSAWTPWTEVKIDCEDMPLTPIVWNGRLFLFWLTAVKTVVPQTIALPSGNITNVDLSTVHSAAQTAAAAQGSATVGAVLHWCEYCNGKWQPSKTSELCRPTALGTFPTAGSNSFDVDRNLLRIVPVQLVSGSPVTIPSNALILAIGSSHYPSWPSGGFVLYNTHSLPVRFEDITGVVDIHVLNSSLSGHMIVPLSWFVASPSRGRTLAPIQPYTGGNTSAPFSIAYWTSASGPDSPIYDNDLIRLNWLPRTVEPQIGTSDAWDAPFLFEDRQNAFYVTTSLSHHTIRGYSGFGILSTSPGLVASVAKIPPLMTRQAAARGAPVNSIVTGNVVGRGDPTAIKDYLQQSMTIRTAVGSTGAVFYQGRPIYPSGSAGNLPAAEEHLTMASFTEVATFHYANDVAAIMGGGAVGVTGGFGDSFLEVADFAYTFQPFFHPFVGQLIQKLNQTDVAGMLDPGFLATLLAPYSSSDYSKIQAGLGHAISSVDVTLDARTIDLAVGGSYAIYNWELLYHIPVMIAVHLSSNQRFAEAQKWFHYVFDPTSTDAPVPAPQRFWKFLAFRSDANVQNINTLLQLLSTPDTELDAASLAQKRAVQSGYDAMLANPFQPHAVARTRQSAYQWYVAMKYLDNLIAWGDSLFMQDTIETLNEATLCYVLAANILGPRPQALPARGVISPKNFQQLKQAGLDPMGNALVALEAQFPFNLAPTFGTQNGSSDPSGPLFGIGRALYFCIPVNRTLLAYWDTVADRLFKIRNSENIQGVVQQLPLFDPPLDPGMLVKANAAGIDIGSVVSGLNQPLGPVRSPLLIQKALELAGEVRALGNELLAAQEKGDAEQLALLRQGHEIALQGMVQNMRFLQWQHARESTTVLLKTRSSALERYAYYLRLLGLTPDSETVPLTFDPDRRELTEDNFDDTYGALVERYDRPVALQAYPAYQPVGGAAPSNQAGATGPGQLYLNKDEDSELSSHLPTARDRRWQASLAMLAAPALNLIPDMHLDLHFWGLGAHTKVFGGDWLAEAAKITGELLQIDAAYEQDQAGIASRTAGYQRRADEWLLQANLAARELVQIGRQIIASLIDEQIAYHDYKTIQTQVQQAQDVQAFLKSKFTSAVFYGWMQSEISGLYYQYYRFACDTARKAEQTMKRELMRPELDQTKFIQFNYWDAGRQGLLSGEALYLDVKRMEMAYHDNNKRELELTRHISLRQLDPLALIALKVTGGCTVNVPEWLFDCDCPGLYMRRIKNVSLSVPSVVGPYTSINCTLSLQCSTVRVKSGLNNGVYARDTSNTDDRFVDYFGGSDTIVTSSGSMDSGMFETNLRDERFLPFEGAGVVSSWSLALPVQLRPFDYTTISDVILHIRYTARDAGDPLAAPATKELVAMLDTVGQSGQALMFCLRFDFPSQWYAFVTGTANFTLDLTKDLLPYMVQSANRITIDALTLYAAGASNIVSVTPTVDLGALSSGLSAAAGTATLSLPSDATVMTRDPKQQVFLVMQYNFGA